MSHDDGKTLIYGQFDENFQQLRTFVYGGTISINDSLSR